MTELRVVNVICTGNICRSPMGKALLEKSLAELGVVDVDVRSSGTHATTGSPAMRAAVEAAERRGARVGDHRATFLDRAVIMDAHLLLCATQDHRDHILLGWPDVDPRRVRLFNEALDLDDQDVADPYGWDDGVYELASKVIASAMAAWAQRLADGTELDDIEFSD
ncbi:MAG: protein-tyrosine-phosphatase [Planctomycetota bacterium]|nr:MAG: protein-tyrosine-phosphatase [Planctomycetota bacterium]